MTTQTNHFPTIFSAICSLLLAAAIAYAAWLITAGQADYTAQLRRQTDRLATDALLLRDLSKKIDGTASTEHQPTIEQPTHSPDIQPQSAGDDPFSEIGTGTNWHPEK